MLTLRQVRLAWILVLPTLLVVVLVAGYPLAQVFYWSFFKADIAFVEPPEFVGLENYAYLFQDPDFRQALWNTLKFTVVSVSLETVLGLAIASSSTPTSVAGAWCAPPSSSPGPSPRWSRPRCGSGC